MTHNMGTIDRGLRTFVAAPALILLAWSLGFGSVLGIVAVVFAVVMVATSGISFCPLYTLLGVTTCPNKGAR